MKKFIAAFSVITLAGVLVMPKLVGHQAKPKIDTLFTQLTSPELQLSWQSYQQGWFSSSGVINADIVLAVDAEQEPERMTLQYHVTLDHGPVMFAKGIAFGWLQWHAELMVPDTLTENISLTDQPLNIQTGRLSLFQNISFEQSTPKFTYVHENVTVNASSSYGNGTIDNHVIRYSGGMDSLTVENLQTTQVFALNDLVMSVESHLPKPLGQNGITASEARVHVGTISDGAGFTANDSELVYSTFLEDGEDHADLAARLFTKNLSFAEQNVSNITLDLMLRNYNLAYDRLMQHYLLQATTAAGYSDTPTLMTEEQKREALQLFFASQPELEVRELAFALPEGDVSAQLALKLNDYDVPASSLMNPLALFSNLDIEGTISSAEPAAVRLTTLALARGMNPNSPQAMGLARVMLYSLQQKGFIAQASENRYTTTLAMNQGQATVNGKPLTSLLSVL